MPQTPYPRSDRELLSRIARSAGGRAGYKQLVRELGLGGGRERRLLVEQLTRMVARGELARAGDDLWSVPRAVGGQAEGGRGEGGRGEGGRDTGGRNTGGRGAGSEADRRSGRDRLVSGRLDLHRDGFGFVRPEAAAGGSKAGGVALSGGGAGSTGTGTGGRPAGREGDIFIPPNEIHGAMQGDVVLVEEAPLGRDGRRSGRIARVLTRRNPTVVGIFHYGRTAGRAAGRGAGRGASLAGSADGVRGNYVTPLDERIGGPIAIPDGAERVAAEAGTLHRTLGEEAWRGRGAGVDDRRDRPVDEGALAEEAALAAGDGVWDLEGLAVDVEITAFPGPGRPAVGRVIEVLGPPDGFGVDVEIVIRKHHIPHTFPAPVLAEAEDRARETVASLAAEDLERREAFGGLPVVTIDGETARDFDDAVLVRELANGNSELQVHIADVSHYVRPGSAIDLEARVRGTSVYFPDRAVPMLPHALSSGMCSLLPQEDRLVLSCVMEIDRQGEVVRYRVAEGVIRSVRRMTYTSVQHCLDAAGGVEADAAAQGLDRGQAESLRGTAEDRAERDRVEAESPGLAEAVDRMLALALRLNAKRVRRGSIDFDLPEPVVTFDAEGQMRGIVRSERGWAHRLIEEFMLSANECVAHWLEGRGLERPGVASIYRIHEMPDPKRIVDFEETAAQFGHSLGLGSLPVKRFTMKADRRESRERSARGQSGRSPQAHEVPESLPVTPQMYQRLVKRISGTAEERILSYLMLRSLKQARYAEKNEGHFALASPSYTHFTSPIRRYPDLIVHRLVRTMLERGADPHGGAIRSDDWQPWSERPGTPGARVRIDEEGPMAAEELNDIAVESSQAERRAADAERELIEWKKMRFMEDKVGDDFSAVILSCTKYGFFVELDEMFIEGLVPIGSLVGDFYSFRDADRTIVGSRTGHVFGLGERVQVLLDRIDRQQRRLQFALLPGTEPKGSAGAGREARAPGMRRGKSEAKKAKAQAKQGRSRKRR